jgi:peptidoglycan/LPS O-acetylase OafA/YrhL
VLSDMMLEDKLEKLRFLDALRGIAIFLVLMVHTGASELPASIQPIIYAGSRGVQLFFIVSSITLFLTLDRRKLKEKHLYKNFYIRRLFRIAPLFYLATIFYLYFNGLGPRFWLADQGRITLYNILSHFLFLNSFYPYWINSIIGVEWSIAVEMIFYLLIPILHKLITSLEKATRFTFSMIILSYFANKVLVKKQFITSYDLWIDYLHFWLPSQLPVFALGIALYFILFKNGYLKESIIKLDRKKQISVTCFLISIYLLYSFINMGNEYITREFLFAIGFSLLIFAVAVYPLKLIVNRFWCFLGEMSFSIYLVHFAVITIVGPVVDRNINRMGTVHYLVKFILTLILSCIVSYLTSRFIEKPFQAYANKIIRKSENNKTDDLESKKMVI